MKYLLLADTFYPAQNGVVHAVVQLANGLIMQGHEVLIVVPVHPRSRAVKWSLDPQVKVELVRSMPAFVYPDLRLMLPLPSVFRRIQKFNPDVVQVHGPMAAGFIAHWYSQWQHKPVVAFYNTHLEAKDSLRIVAWWLRPVFKVFQKIALKQLMWSYRRYAAVVAPTAEVQVRLAEHGVSSTVIPLPVPVEELVAGASSGKALRAQLGLNQSKNVLFAGRLSIEKSIQHVITAFAEVHHHLPGAKLVILGEGPMRAQLERQVAELQLIEAVQFLGGVPYKKLIEEGWFYLGDVFVTMSGFETQGLSTIEAMACGLPVVAAAAAANVDVVTDVGLLVPAGDSQAAAAALVQILSDSKLEQQLSRQSRQAAQRYTIENCCKEINDLCQRASRTQSSTRPLTHSS